MTTARSELFFGGTLDGVTNVVDPSLYVVLVEEPETGVQQKYVRHHAGGVGFYLRDSVSFFALVTLSKEELESAAHVAVHKVLY